MMTMKLLLLLFVVNLPSCWSLCDINAARRCAHVEGKCKKLGKWNKFAEDVAKQAAEVAGVLEPKVVEAFQEYADDSEDDSSSDDDDHSDRRPNNICLLFTAWSKECISHLLHCVASMNGDKNVKVACDKVGFLQGFRKSGGFSYIPKDANELLIGFEFNDATSNAGSIVVPCRAMNKASPEIQPICVSAVDRQKPDRYIVHRFGKVFLETEYATASPETFDEDASWYGVQDEFFPGFSTWRPLSLPNHYTHGSSSNRQIVSELQNTTEFFNSASWHVFDRSKKELFPCSSCEEIHSLDSKARSGLYVIKTEDGTLEQVHCEMEEEGMIGSS